LTSRRQLAPFAALCASYFAHVGFFNPYLPLWLQDLGLSLFTISVLTSLQSATRLFAPYAWGAWSDRTGERVKLLRYGASVALLASLGLWLNFDVTAGSAHPVFWMGAVLLVMFAHTSGMMPMSEATMAHLVSQGGAFDVRRYGRVRLFGSLGFMVTVFFAGAWFEHFGMAHFPFWTSLTLLAVVVSVWVMPDLKEALPVQLTPPLLLPVLRQRPVQWLFAASFFHVLAHVSINVFLSLYLDSLGYSKTQIGLLWVISVAAEVGWFFTQGRWLPRLGLSAWLLVAASVAVVRMGLMVSAANWWPVLVLAQLLHAITFAAHHTVSSALISHHFPGALRGRGQALNTVIAYGLSGVLGGLAGGGLSSHFGLTAVFWASLGASVLAVVCAGKVWRLNA
jgi:MFS transporter, PPP family, 3-phenylpropionic acid transporter